MKTMNKYFKVVLCFIAFAICSFLMVFSPSISAVSAMEYAIAEYNMAINSVNMPTKVNPESEKASEKEFLVPVHSVKEAGKWGNSTNVEQIVRVIDPAGKAHDYNATAEKAVNDVDNNYFTLSADKKTVKVNALNNGNYQVVYITNATTGTDPDTVTKSYYSNIYNVTVENASYELDFTNANGLTNLYKSEVVVNSGKIEVYSVKANVVGGSSSVTLTPAQCVTVTKNNAPQVLDAQGSDFVSGTGADAGKFFINPTATGVYTIEYTYKESTNRPTKTFTINVVKAEDYKDGKTLTANTPSLPSMQLGQTGIALPKLTVNNEYTKDIAHNVTSIVIQKQYSNIKQTLPANTYEFDFTLEKFENATSYADMAGIYEVIYNIEDAYATAGSTEHKTTKTIKTSYISVSEKPSVSLAYDYNITAEESTLEGKNDFKVTDAVVTDYAETSLKSNYGYTEVLLPAMYGTDNVTNTKDLIFVRYLVNSNTRKRYYVDNVKVEDGKLVTVTYGTSGYNYALYNEDGANKTAKTGTPNMAQKFQFSESGNDAEFSGTYYLEYQVVSTTVKDRTGYLYMPGTTTQYSINVTKDPTNDSKSTPTVEITNLKDSAIRPEDGVTVKVTSTDEHDTRLKNSVFYYTSKVDSKGTPETTDDEVVTVTDTMLQTDVFNAFKEARDVVNNKENVLDSDAFIAEMEKLGYKNFNVIAESETTNAFVLNSFDVTALSAADDNYDGKIKVFATVLNDNPAVAVDSITLTLKNTTESNAPVAEIVDTGDLYETVDTKVSDSKTFKQNVEVELPTVFFNEFANSVTIGDNNLQMSVMYYIDSPESNAGLNYRYPVGVTYGANTIKGGKITTSETGTYYVVYTAIDDAGNTSVSYFTFVVEDSSKPILSVNVTSKDELTQSGNTITTEIGSTLDFETIVRSGDGKATDYTDIANVSIEISTEAGLSYMPSGNAEHSYIFNSVGTYTVTIKAQLTDGSSRETDSKVLYVKVTKPTIVWLEEFDIPKHATLDSIVYLPDIAASHNAVVTVTVTAPGGATPTAGDAYKTVEGGISVWCFKTNKTVSGTYTVKYTATSQYGTISKEFSIKVGDSVAPTISMNYENELTQNIVYTGSDIEYVFDVVKSISNRKFVITVNRDGEQVYSYDLGLNITDLKDDGTTTHNYSWSRLDYKLTGDNVTSNGNGKYTITGTGECTLTLTITDDYNNTTTKNIYFNVVSESEPEEVNNTALGTVLIIVSLVILAGVILFFIFTGNKKGGSKKTSKKLAKEIKATIDEKKAVEEKVEVEEAEEKEEVAEVEPAAEEKTEEPESSSDDEAKTGEVE